MPSTASRSRAVRTSLFVLGLALVVAVAALVMTERSQDSPSTPAGSAVSLAEVRKRPPIYRFLYDWTPSARQIAVAQGRLITTCMAGHGFTYTPPPVATVEEGAQWPTPFGLETLDVPGTDTAETLPPEEPKGEAYTRALFGDPDDRIRAKSESFTVSRPATGCQAEAEERLLGDERLRWLRLRLRLGDGEREAFDMLEKAPGFRAAQARWRTCMKETGFDEKDPLRFLNSLPADTDIRTHRAARADVRCKADTDYLVAAYSELAAAQEKWLDEHPDVRAGWTELRKRQEAEAHRVLAE
ncbi:hypothetical protein ACFS5L_16925 [Streptomyces phyllanthi]|uniref:Uncharacterized protein n=1 Tax=Streptomyces phyllanthi TaxID=1803180 RepID=A0A5N8WGB6_9ACTN|nr:hypothetical protein [Streptomyces phyllanthi]MPY46172.1 hypothetical protein [Streptomyces phyllanthi]